MCLLIDIGVTNLSGNFKDGAIRACNEVCRKNMCRRKGDIWRLDWMVRLAKNKTYPCRGL